MIKGANPYILFFEKNKKDIPNIDRLIKHLKNDRNEGHLVHAKILKRFFDSDIFKITDVEKRNGYDIDIELDNHINIQVWHGASVASHNSRRKKGTWYGGVETDWNKDKEKIEEKLNQLPNNKPGFVVCINSWIGISVLPEWLSDIKDNKAIIEHFVMDNGKGLYDVAHLHCSDNFKHMDLAKKISKALSFNLILKNKI